jgi:hypothetical protein
MNHINNYPLLIFYRTPACQYRAAERQANVMYTYRLGLKKRGCR